MPVDSSSEGSRTSIRIRLGEGYVDMEETSEKLYIVEGRMPESSFRTRNDVEKDLRAGLVRYAPRNASGPNVRERSVLASLVGIEYIMEGCSRREYLITTYLPAILLRLCSLERRSSRQANQTDVNAHAGK